MKLFNTLRSCERCVHYIPRELPYLGRCRLFGEQDPETKKVTYYDIDLCRKEEHKCGKGGKSFMEVKS